jgi:hypothetical protein
MCKLTGDHTVKVQDPVRVRIYGLSWHVTISLKKKRRL